MITEKHLNIAYKLLKCRSACRGLYGEGWVEKQAEWKPIIQAVMTKHKCEELGAAVVLGAQLEGIPLMTCLGVIMEMMDDQEVNNG